MSFDPSRMLYAHPHCGKIPCDCTREHSPLDIMTFQCTIDHCIFYAETINQLQEHRMNQHCAQQSFITPNGTGEA